MFKSEGTYDLCTKMNVEVRIHTKMYDIPRIVVQQSTTMYDNLRKYTNKYEMMFNYVRQCSTKNTSLRYKCCRTQNFTFSYNSYTSCERDFHQFFKQIRGFRRRFDIFKKSYIKFVVGQHLKTFSNVAALATKS